MATKTITGKVTGPDGSNKGGAVITATLSQPCVITGTQEVAASRVVTTTATDGTYTLTLQANNDLTPTGTFYTVTESATDGGFYSFTIVVPQTAGPFVMSSIQTNPPTASPTPSHVSTLTVDNAAAFTNGPVTVGNLPVRGRNVVIKTSGYTASDGDVVLANATSGAIALTLPPVAAGIQVIVKKTDNSANKVTVAPQSGTIDGAANFVIWGQYHSVTFVSDGTNWYVTETQIMDGSGNVAAGSFTASSGPYVSTAKAGGADYGGAVRIAGGRPLIDWTHPGYGVADPTATAAQNRTAINAALAAAAAIPGAMVIGPPGNFHIDQAIPVNVAPVGGSYEAGMSIQGMGQGVTTLTQDTANTDVFQIGTTAQNWATNIRIRDLTLAATRYALNLNSSINGLYERITTVNGVSGIFQQGTNERHVFRDIEIENPSGRGIDCKGNTNGALITDPLSYPESQKQMFEHIRIYHSSIWGIDYGAGIINAQQQNSGHVTFRHILFESNLGGDIHVSNSFGATIEHCTNEDSFTTNNNVVAFLFDLNPGRITMMDCFLSTKSSVPGNFYQYVIQQMAGVLVMINVTTSTGAGAATADLHVEAEGLALDCMFTLNSIQLVGQGANKFLFIECRYGNNTDAYPGANALTAQVSGVSLQQLQVLANAEFLQGLDWPDGQGVTNGVTGTGDFVTTQATGRFRFRRTIDNAQILDLTATSRTATFYGPLYPGVPALGSQATIAIYGGSGVPSNANGNNGDEYHRGDTPATANQRIYNKQAGAWVGIL